MSSSKELYRRFQSLCQRWPVDKGKSGRDLGEYYRQHFAKVFPHGQLSSLEDIKLIEAQIEALENVASNKYYNVSTLLKSTSTGLEPTICDQAMTNEGLEQAKELNEQSVIQQLKMLLSDPHVNAKSSEQHP